MLENVLENVKIDQKQKKVSQNEKSVLNEQSVRSRVNVNSENEIEIDLNVQEKDRQAEQSTPDIRASPMKSPIQNSRPSRERKTPQRFSDFVMSKI